MVVLKTFLGDFNVWTSWGPVRQLIPKVASKFYDFMQKCCCELFIIGIKAPFVSPTTSNLELDHMVEKHNTDMLTKIIIS